MQTDGKTQSKTGKRIKGWQVCQRSNKRPEYYILICRYCGAVKLVEDRAVNKNIESCSCGHYEKDKLEDDELQSVALVSGTYCKYPAAGCKKNNRYGGCCSYCKKKKYCTNPCLNSPENCGSFKY